MLEMFSYSFVIRALIVGVLVSLCIALLGVSMVLKRHSMIGDGLSHVGFAALTLAMVANLAPLVVSIPIVVAAAFLLLRIRENGKIKGDAAIAMISGSALAIGMILVSLNGGVNVDVYGYMFGTILAMSETDVYISVGLSFAVLIVYTFFYGKIFAITFDEDFAKATGTKTGAYNTMLALLTAVTIVLGMRMIGALLISSLLVFPALTAMRVFDSFRRVVICTVIVSVCCFFGGLLLSLAFPLPSGASVVVVNLAMFLLFSAVGRIIRGGKTAG